jgi:hypothetical protein
VLCTAHHTLFEYHINKDEMDTACCMYRGEEKCVQNCGAEM